jgi:prolyl 4-hydroxylase
MGKAAASKLFEQAAAIARSGRPEDGVRFIEETAGRGDPDANVIVAHWLLYGSDRARDPGAACCHLERAGESGSTEALRILAHLTASGTGRGPDREQALELLKAASESDAVAAGELALLGEVMNIDDAKRAARELISADPHIEILRGLLLPQECEWLIRRAAPLLRPSFVADGRTGRGRPDPIRTSHGAAFVPHEADLVVQEITGRIAALTGTAESHAEALYVMRYEPGQQYRPHLDALRDLKNQREWTAIAYLNDRFVGGATAFPELGLSLRLGLGDVLVFRDSDTDQQPDLRMRHAGEPVTSGEKWVATRWIRHGPHDPYDRG